MKVVGRLPLFGRDPDVDVPRPIAVEEFAHVPRLARTGAPGPIISDKKERQCPASSGRDRRFLEDTPRDPHTGVAVEGFVGPEDRQSGLEEAGRRQERERVTLKTQMGTFTRHVAAELL